MSITIGARRADGKYPVVLTFQGGANAFGGRYPDTVYRKLYTLEKVKEAVQKHGTEQQKAAFCNQP